MCLVTQLCPILYDPMNWSPPSFSAHGIFLARILEWVAFSFSKIYYGQLMNEDPRSIPPLMKETSYKTGTCEKLNRVEVKSQKGKENRYGMGLHWDMKNYNNASELRCFRMQSALPLLSHFVLVATSWHRRNHPSLRKKERRLQEVEWLVGHYNHGDG